MVDYDGPIQSYIDTLRRRARFDASQDDLVRYLEAQRSSAERSNQEENPEDGSLEDDRLRLAKGLPSIFVFAVEVCKVVRWNGRTKHQE